METAGNRSDLVDLIYGHGRREWVLVRGNFSYSARQVRDLSQGGTGV